MSPARTLLIALPLLVAVTGCDSTEIPTTAERLEAALALADEHDYAAALTELRRLAENDDLDHGQQLQARTVSLVCIAKVEGEDAYYDALANLIEDWPGPIGAGHAVSWAEDLSEAGLPELAFSILADAKSLLPEAEQAGEPSELTLRIEHLSEQLERELFGEMESFAVVDWPGGMQPVKQGVLTVAAAPVNLASEYGRVATVQLPDGGFLLFVGPSGGPYEWQWLIMEVGIDGDSYQLLKAGLLHQSHSARTSSWRAWGDQQGSGKLRFRGEITIDPELGPRSGRIRLQFEVRTAPYTTPSPDPLGLYPTAQPPEPWVAFSGGVQVAVRPPSAAVEELLSLFRPDPRTDR